MRSSILQGGNIIDINNLEIPTSNKTDNLSIPTNTDTLRSDRHALTRPLSRNRRLQGTNKHSKRRKRKCFNSKNWLLNNNMVTNLSSVTLTLDEISVLNKGLGFVPSHIKPKFKTINDDLLRFERKLQLHYHFNKKKDLDCMTVEPFIKKKFEGNSTWWPRILNPHITKLCYNLKEFIFNVSNHSGTTRNLSIQETKALNSLKSNTNIIFKKADKGGGIVCLDRSDYLDKVNSLLNDTQTYIQTDINDTLNVKADSDKLLKNLRSLGFLSDKQFYFLTNFEARCPLFYGIPKLHKENFPLRPIVSQTDGPTSRLNLLVDSYLRTAESQIPFLLQDTTAFLQLIEKNKICTPDTFLVTMDVTSLYTNIPHEEGCRFVCEFYEETLQFWMDPEIPPIPSQILFELMMFILKNCTFEFHDNFYKQLFGTTMGASFSVKFANIYMFIWFRKHIASYKGISPQFLARLIDDVFFFWTDSEETLKAFIEYLNNCHDTIKFEATYSHNRVHFLDTVIYIQENQLKSTVYIKPSDKKQYLHFTSHHPPHVMQAIPFSQALRYRRIIDDDQIFDKEILSLSKFFLNRGYPRKLLHECFEKVRTIDRNSTLIYKGSIEKQLSFDKFLKGKSFLPLIIHYNFGYKSSNIFDFLHFLWEQLIQGDETLNKVFQHEFPQVVYKRGTTLQNLLISSKFSSPLDSQDIENIKILKALELENKMLSFELDTQKVLPCNVPRCKCCYQILSTSVYFNSTKTQQFEITSDFNCCSSDVLYLISCLKCDKLYVGQTGRPLKQRLNNHRSDISLKKNTAVALHFNEPTHKLSDLKITPILDISQLNFDQRSHLEFEHMKMLDTIYPKGLNLYPILK